MTDADLVALKLARMETLVADDDVDLDIVEDTVRHRLGDLLAFVAVIRARLPE